MTKATLTTPFSAARIALLCRNRAFEDLPALGIGAGVLVGINLLTLLFAGRTSMNDSDGQTWTFAIMVAGLILSSAAFRSMHDSRGGTDWILLPASSVEKYAAALFSYLVAYPIAASIATMALSAILSLLELAAGGPGGNIWNPIAAIGLKGWANYAIAALVLAVGSATFRKRALIKTIGVIVACSLAAAGIFFLAVFIVRDLRGLPSFSFMARNGGFSVDGDFSWKAPPAAKVLLDIACYAILPISALAYGYFRVAEKEALDEVQ
jgi:hypothetical protein